ncbi:MAG: triose-phosphate isomerase [Gammaproteobacteria bacterium]|nr:triose-phosphate isomerase [Gammaproteobacteria bacterium]
MPQRIVAGNWKMHGSRQFLAGFLASLTGDVLAKAGCEVLLFPPATLLPLLSAQAPDLGIGLGIQTVHPESQGAFTGEIAAEMAADVGATWTLVGHSERRQIFGESDADVALRALAARRAGLRTMLCVGESLAERQRGDAEAVVTRQLDAVLEALGDDLATGGIAYEPVWAIGTGETASPEMAQAMHAMIRGVLRRRSERLAEMPILYGGSVKPANAAALFAEVDIDGALVGGASLDPAAFLAIIRAMETHGNP